MANEKHGFGTWPVYLTAISSILGAILFLRLGLAVGTLGFWGTIAILLLGHLITIPTALAISELSTNTRVEGGGVYFIISRSFGLKLGATIGIALYLSQAISIAFYIVAFAESFSFLFDWWQGQFGWELPRQVISVPMLLVCAVIILRNGAGSGMKMLYFVVLVLAASLLLFYFGKPVVPVETAEGIYRMPADNFGFFNRDQFFILFAICFPAFTGITAGVGLSGDLRNPGRAIPAGTIAATISGLVIYSFVVWKLAVSASPDALTANQMVMSRIALFGSVIIPLGLMAATSSSAIGVMLVAPRTLQAIAADRVLPFRKLNLFLARGKGPQKEPYNASLLTFILALVFVLLGDVNSVARIITLFFLITYGTLCLNSFLNHFGSPPSYRPRFRSRWYFSLAGFLLSVWVMFKIDPLYTILSYIVIVAIYLYIERVNREKKGIVNIFKGALFQLNRKLQVYMQKHRGELESEEWRPAAVCISSHSFEREKVLDLMRWISRRHGFGTYFHYIKGLFNEETHAQAQAVLEELVRNQRELGSALYIDTMISPSYTTAIAQIVQAPSISGMENNTVVFEYDRREPEELTRILGNVGLVRAGGFDTCIFAGSAHPVRPDGGLHVWIRKTDEINTNFMILLGYIILSHPDWRRSPIRIFVVTPDDELEVMKKGLEKRIATGRMPITMANIEIIPAADGMPLYRHVEEHSAHAGLTLIGFGPKELALEGEAFFTAFDAIGDVLFVNSCNPKEIA